MDNLRLTSAAPGFYGKLHVGAGTTIATDVTINLDDTVTIGRDVGIAPGVRVYTGSHRIGPAPSASAVSLRHRSGSRTAPGCASARSSCPG